MKTDGVVYFHQGWTDIINCLALIHFYKQTYTRLFIIIRDDATPLLSYYIRHVSNTVSLIEMNKDILDRVTPIDIIQYHGISLDSTDLLFHGQFDIFRNDIFCGNFMNSSYDCFVKSFYATYGISPSTRISSFTLERNPDLEDNVYNKFVETHGSSYALHHEVSDKIPKDTVIPYINLAQSSEVFFDMIKVLEHAKEIHLLDSVWAAILYLLQGRYGICAQIPVHVYCKRGYVSMFTDPIALPNWKIYSGA